MQKTYYTIEITYRSENETKLIRFTNFDARALQIFRENMFVCGVYRRIDGDTGEIISPFQIVQTMLYKQAHFFSESADLKKPLTKSS